MHFGIENPETPTRDKTEVMGIVVIFGQELSQEG
jgi:hypothetical protein